MDNHEPIISRELWDKVQSVLDRKCSYRYRVIKHDLAFSGMIRCGHCGCAVIGEIKKKKYIYYHCTGQRGKCPEKYARQELIEAQFCLAVNKIVLPEPFVGWASESFRRNSETVGESETTDSTEEFDHAKASNEHLHDTGAQSANADECSPPVRRTPKVRVVVTYLKCTISAQTSDS
jgi:Recombinase zinc beta ribbon domain